jgi:hypothetical protein
LLYSNNGIPKKHPIFPKALFHSPAIKLLGAGNATSTAGYDVARLREDVIRDRYLLHDFAERAGKVTRACYPKLTALAEQLIEILKSAEVDGLDDKNKQNKHKVIVFSFFADTVEWIREYLEGVFATDVKLAAYRGRLARVVGDEGCAGISREAAIFGFATESSEALAGRRDDLYDVLVTTDVLSEGMNLQQCRNIINYDLPWNPMRRVQRHGRIDRIGSPHKDVFMRCFFPDVRLEALLLREARIRNKLALAAATVGVENDRNGTNIGGCWYREILARPTVIDSASAEQSRTTGVGQSFDSIHQARKNQEEGLQLSDLKQLPYSRVHPAQGHPPSRFLAAHVGSN